MRRMPTRAMVLAAGLGRRMRSVTETLPKPLIPLAGKPLIAHTLDLLAAESVTDIVVNTHHRADQLEAYLACYAAGRTGPTIHVSREETLLDTGGGVRHALELLGSEPFLVLNSDVVLTDGAAALRRLAATWDDAHLDAVLLLCPLENAAGYEGRGDFERLDDGTLARRAADADAPFVFAGVQLLHPRLFADAPSGAYSLNHHYDEAIARGRLQGVVHDSLLLHAGTPDGLSVARRHLEVGGHGRAP